MNSTPPSAESISLLVLIAVDPRCSPTRSARCASTTSGRTSRPRAEKMRPRIRATVVLPVPGGPVNTKCRTGAWLASPCRSRIRATRSWAAISWTWRLTGSGATLPPSGARALPTGRGWSDAYQRVHLGQRALHGRRLAVAAEPGGQLRVGLLQVGAVDRDQVGLGRLG